MAAPVVSSTIDSHTLQLVPTIVCVNGGHFMLQHFGTDGSTENDPFLGVRVKSPQSPKFAPEATAESLLRVVSDVDSPKYFVTSKTCTVCIGAGQTRTHAALEPIPTAPGRFVGVPGLGLDVDFGVNPQALADAVLEAADSAAETLAAVDSPSAIVMLLTLRSKRLTGLGFRAMVTRWFEHDGGEGVELLKRVQALDLSCNTLSRAVVKQDLIGFTQLQHLRLNFCNLGDAGVTAIASALQRDRAFPQLAHLSLRANFITASGSEVLCHAIEHTATSLTELNLSSNELGDGGAYAIASVIATATVPLRILKLRMIAITDTGIGALVRSLKQTRQLTALDLAYNDIDAAGVQTIVRALESEANCKSLMKLTLSVRHEETLMSIAVAIRTNSSLSELHVLQHGFCDQRNLLSTIFEKNRTLQVLHIPSANAGQDLTDNDQETVEKCEGSSLERLAQINTHVPHRLRRALERNRTQNRRRPKWLATFRNRLCLAQGSSPANARVHIDGMPVPCAWDTLTPADGIVSVTTDRTRAPLLFAVSRTAQVPREVARLLLGFVAPKRAHLPILTPT